MSESELPCLVAGLPVYYHRSKGDRVSATIVGPFPRGGRRVSIRYNLGSEEVLYEHAPEHGLECALVTAESPGSPQPVHHEALMDALRAPGLPEVKAEAPRNDDHEPKAPRLCCPCVWFVMEVRARCRNWEPGTCDKHQIQKKNIPGVQKIGP